ncbi:MAG: type I DNA topoisomerase [Spirochaetaceae bacterium]|nr:type I DNA topoisomerase [Spirochaetaceae bacterium]
MPKPAEKALVIVESPAKANTIARFLGDGFVVESSIGHIRDLPRSAADVPARYKQQPWARLGIDVDNGFKPLYVVPPDKRRQIKKLKDLLATAEVLYLATDEDREGEAIAWHLYQELKPPKGMDVKRMVFHEITRPAIEAAIAEPRDIDRRLVDAQEARRILDRLYGYEVSPVLWKKVQPRLSAGRVQSVATRIAVERERERMAFVVARYWSLTATFGVTAPESADTPRDFTAALATLDGKPVAVGSSFKQNGELKRADTVHLDENAARTLADGLKATEFRVRGVERKPYRRRPAAPFMTSTFQQEAGRKLRMSATAAMRVAQSLYEKGYITYMRTDSTTLSQAALHAARDAIAQRFGPDYLPPAPRRYAKKVKNAQEAHEAIRPAGDRFRTPEETRSALPRNEAAAYELIWKRTIASQMTDAVGSTVQVRVGGEAADGRDAQFSAAGTTISHYGFRRVYSEGTDAEGGAAARANGDPERALPDVSEGDQLGLEGIEPAGHETSPPARHTEASLVKRLEELGVGRPSTYASIMNTIQDRGYVWKRGTAMVPTFTAFSVVRLLEQHFSDLVDYTFTARMEDELDNIATGDEDVQPWLRRFYFGAEVPGRESDQQAAEQEAPGLKTMVSDRLGRIDAREVNSVAIGTDGSGAGIVARVGRFGPYVERGPQRATIPEEIPPDELTVEAALELIDKPNDDRVLGEDPDTGLPVIARAGRFGPYVQAGTAEDTGKKKPKTASLLRSMTLDSIDLGDALKLLTLPRTVGTDPADGTPITAQNGRYGPYIQKGSDSRTLESEDLLFTISVEECLAILAQPKGRRGQAAAQPPLRELGNDPASGQPMVIKEGRWGPYVTDGETNASLRTGDTVEALTPERGAELLQLRRERGPAKRPAKRPARRKSAASSKRPTPQKAAS